jgi:hypothetical protein
MLLARHLNEIIMRVTIGRWFYWPKMKEDIKHFVHNCVKCQNTKFIYRKFGLVKLLTIWNKPWGNVSMDFMM